MALFNRGKRGGGCLIMLRRKIVFAMGVFEFPMKRRFLVDEEESKGSFSEETVPTRL